MSRTVWRTELEAKVVCLLVTLTCSVIAVVISGCGESLTRKKAAKLIVEKMGYPKPESIRVDVFGGICDPYGNMLYERLGLVKFQRGRYYEVVFELTEKARALGFVKSDRGLKGKLCEKVFIAVTGLKVEGKRASVEYTWKYDNPTAVCKTGYYDPWLVDEPAQISKLLGSPQRGVCLMGLYDDGWRVEDIDEGMKNR
jgi:hypothetical protein